MNQRHRASLIWKSVFFLSTILAVVVLIVLILTIIDGAFGYVVLQPTIPLSEVVGEGRTLDDLSQDQLIEVLKVNESRGLIRRLESEQPLAERTKKQIVELVMERVLDVRVVQSWNLFPSILHRDEVIAFRDATPNGIVEFRAWITPRFLTTQQSPVPEKAGIRTAVFGSLWMIALTILFAFPVGVASAIYLEEYAADNWINRIIEVNIGNLSGVPSIIYGLLGLTVFVRFFEPITSGQILGSADPATANGRTIISAGLTLALLILPIIIINSREAIRGVPRTLRESSYGLGATKWQTVWHHVLPSAFDRILTGTIIAVSRAVGETAPLVVIGASTFIAVDPTSLFSKFTTLPIQIYQWSARPQGEFRNVAAAAIIVLLVILLFMNSFAIVMRDRMSRRRRNV